MKSTLIGRSRVKANILDNDEVLIASNHTYTPQTEDHRRTWPRVVAAIGEKGAWYSTLRAIAGGNYDYIAYLIGDVGGTGLSGHGRGAWEDRGSPLSDSAKGARGQSPFAATIFSMTLALWSTTRWE